MFSKYYIPFAVWASVIFIIIAIPGTYIPKPHGIWEMLSPDKIVHLLMFAPFSFLLAWGLFRTKKRWGLIFFLSTFFGIIYAISTELLQFYVIIGRNGNIYDALADIIGVSIGLILFYILYKGKRFEYR